MMVKHLGDVTKINGATIEPVDIISFGSPCQDLSVAGKRAGMKNELNGDDETTRSGLFYDSIRIIKEMRDADKRNGRTGIDVRPRWAIWENVPGCFSSNGGDDFRCVLEELARVTDSSAIIPRPTRDGWATAGAILGGGVSTRYSIAYRVLDAQFWGVPQRRRRVFVVADFAGESAPKVLFVRGGLQRSAEQSRETRERTSTNTQESIRETGESIPIDSHLQDTRMNLSPDVFPTLPATMGSGGNNGPMVAEPLAYSVELGAESRVGGHWNKEISPTLRANAGDNQPQVLCIATQQGGAEIYENLCPTITAMAGMSGNNQPCVCRQEPIYAIQGNCIDRSLTAACNGKGWREDKSFTLDTVDRQAVCYGIGRGTFNAGINSDISMPIDEELQPTMTASGPGAVCHKAYGVVSKGNGDAWLTEERHMTLECGGGQAGQGYPCVAQPISFTTGEYMQVDEGKASTLLSRDYKDPQCVMLWNGEQIAPTLTARNAGGAQRTPDKDNFNCVLVKESEEEDE